MNTGAFVSHTSVRIKGTENNYEPVNCSDPKCNKAWPHMHCPFCVKSETFQDPVILKAHYRVKHVDKGIDFAGLKILRCCEHCDIIGTIKGTKQFKGAHWHCYRCKNGFTRRDEAIKHYRTHFRNPSTTFQIQVSQDINQAINEKINKATSNAAVDSINSAPHEMTFVETVVTTMSSENNNSDLEVSAALQEDPPEGEAGKTTSGDMQVSVAANETVGTCEGQTIMIIPSRQNESTNLRNMDSTEVVQTIETTEDLQSFFKQQHKENVLGEQNSEATSVLTDQDSKIQWSKEKEALKKQVAHLNTQVTALITEKGCLENHYKSEISNLKVQLEVANSDIASYQKREAELLNQLKIPLGDRLSSLLVSLKQQHEEVLHQQLAQLRQEYLQQQLNEEFQRTSDMDTERVVRVDVASLVQGDSANSVSQMIVEENNHQVVLSQDSYTSIPASVLTSQALITEGTTTPTQLFVVPHGSNLQVKTEQASRDSDVEEVYHEELEITGSAAAAAAAAAEMEFTHTENEIVTTTNDGENVILLQTTNTNSTDTYEGVTTEHLEITPEGDQVLTLHPTSSSSNKRSFEEDTDDLTNVPKHKQPKEL